MGISFKNTPFKLNGVTIYATTANLTENVGYQRIDELGYSSVGTSQNTRVDGSFSADFYLQSGTFSELLQYTGLTRITGGIGKVEFTNGYMNELSISVEPLSLVKASIRGIFFGGLDWNEKSISDAQENLSITPNEDFVHGSRTTIINHSDALSASYSVSQNISPYYALGSTGLLGYKYDGGEIKVSIQGTGIQEAVDRECSENSPNITINFNPLCGSAFGSEINTSGLKVTSSSISVNADEELVGNMELQKYI